MKFFWISTKVAIALILIGSLSACAIERMRSEQLFEQYCNEEGRVGQFIYQRVALSEEFFRPIPTDGKKLRQVDTSYYFDSNGEKLLIAKKPFKQIYTVNYWERKELSQVGPIYSVETTIVRKSDGKLLSKAVSLLNMQGKTSKYVPVQGVYCSTGRDSKGYHLSGKHHSNLINNTFYKQ